MRLDGQINYMSDVVKLGGMFNLRSSPGSKKRLFSLTEEADLEIIFIQLFSIRVYYLTDTV